MGIKDWFTTERTYEPGGFRRGIKQGTGLVFLKNILTVVFRWVFGIIFVCAILFLLFGTVLFGVRTFSGGSADVVFNKIGVGLSGIPLGNALKGAFSNIFGVIWNPEQVFENNMKSDVDQNVNTKLGVVFTSFKATPDQFVENTKFMSYGGVEITPFEKEEDEMAVEFLCFMEGEECELTEPTELKNIYGYETKTSTIKCRCDAGEAKKNVDGKKVELKAQYNFLTRGYISFYTMSDSKLDAILKTGGNPFENIRDEKLDKKNGVVTSTYTNGPLKLSIGSYYNQPFTEYGSSGPGSYYIMEIQLTKKLAASGNPVPGGMESLKLFVPPFVDIKEDNIFIKDGEDDGLVEYVLSSAVLDRLNNPCRDLLLKIDDLRDPDCRKIWEGGFLPVYVDFAISHAPKNGDLSSSLVMVEARYKYEESIYDDVIVRKTPLGGANEA